jgi:hypothetical protein
MLRKEMGSRKDIPPWRTAWQQEPILAAGLISLADAPAPLEEVPRVRSARPLWAPQLFGFAGVAATQMTGFMAVM